MSVLLLPGNVNLSCEQFQGQKKHCIPVKWQASENNYKTDRFMEESIYLYILQTVHFQKRVKKLHI